MYQISAELRKTVEEIDRMCNWKKPDVPLKSPLLKTLIEHAEKELVKLKVINDL